MFGNKTIFCTFFISFVNKNRMLNHDTEKEKSFLSPWSHRRYLFQTNTVLQVKKLMWEKNLSIFGLMVPRESYPAKIRREIIWFLKSPFQWFIFLNLWKTPEQSTFFWFQFPLININLWIGIGQFSRMTLKKVWKTVFLTLFGGGSLLILTGSRKYIFSIVIFSWNRFQPVGKGKLTVCVHASVKCAHRLYVNFLEWMERVF